MIYRNLTYWNGIEDELIVGDIPVEQGVIGKKQSTKSKDFSGCFAIPGLIDSHVHLCLDPKATDPLRQDAISDLEAKENIRIRAESMIRAGITTARDLGGGKHFEIEARNQIDKNEILGPRLLCAGQPITSLGGHCHFWGGGTDSLERAKQILSLQIKAGVDLIKVMITGGNITPGSKPSDNQFDDDFVIEIVNIAKEKKYPVAAHCHGTEGIAQAVKAGVSTIEHCSWVGKNGWGRDFDHNIAATISEKNIWVSPTINSGWNRFRNSPYSIVIRDNYMKMKDLGIRFIASTDAGIPNIFHNDLPSAIPVFAHFACLTPLEVLKAATSDAALANGLSKITGAIKSGLSADFIIYDKNPLDDLSILSQPRLVVMRGREILPS